MNFNFKFFQKKGADFSSLFVSGNREYINPVRDWMLGLGIGTLIFVGGVAYSIFDFYHQSDGVLSDTVSGNQPVIYQEKEVKRYAELYSEKERIFNELRKNKQTFVQPVQSAQQEDTVAQPVTTPLAPVELAQ